MTPPKRRLREELAGLDRGIWVLFAAVLVNRAGSMVLPFFTLYLTQDLKMPAARAASMLLLYGVGAFVAAYVGGRLSDRLGPPVVLWGSLAASGAIMIAFPFARTPALVGAATLALAIATESFRPASMSHIADLVPPAQRRTGFAVFRLAINLGMSVGPAIGGFLAGVSYPLLFWVNAATTLSAAALLFVAARRAPGPAHRPAENGVSPTRPSPAAFKDRRLLFFLFATFPVVVTIFLHFSAMSLFFVQDLKFTTATYGLLTIINTVLICALEVPIIHATAHWPHRRALVLGALLTGIGFGAMAIAWEIFGVAATIVIWTFGEMLFFPASAAWVTEVAPPQRRGEYNGLFQMSFALAFAVGPWLGTLALAWIGGRALWAETFILCAGAAALISWVQEPERHVEPLVRVPDPSGPAEI
jgi:predicted MFS family arabinose efflux permease